MPEALFNDRRRTWILTAVIVVVAATFGKLTYLTGWFVVTYAVLFIVWIWIPTRYKTLQNALVFTALGVVGIFIASFNPSYHSLAPSFFLPYAGVLGGRGHKNPWSFLAVLCLAVLMVVMASDTLYNGMSNGLAIFGIYWAVNSVHIRREAQQRDRERMQQLEVAYSELQETHRQLMDTNQQIVESRAREARLETLADIHDGVGHQLTSLIVGLESLELMLSDEPQKAREVLPDLVEIARDALQEVRQAVRERSDRGTDLDLYSLINQVSRRGSFESTVDFDLPAEELPVAIRVMLYHVIQESMTNILRHARAHHVDVTLRASAEYIMLTVADDGILTTNVEPGFGLSSLRQRAEAMGGRVEFGVNAPHGLSVQVTLPQPIGRNGSA